MKIPKLRWSRPILIYKITAPALVILVSAFWSASTQAYEIGDPLYYEWVGIFNGETISGKDELTDEYLPHTFNITDPFYGTEFRFDTAVKTFHEGPAAYSKVDGVVNPPPEYGDAMLGAWAGGKTTYKAGVFNVFGTAEPLIVPLVIDVLGWVSADVSGDSGHARAYSYINYTFIDENTRLTTSATACMGGWAFTECPSTSNQVPYLRAEHKQKWNLSVGSDQGDWNSMEVVLRADTRVDLAAWRKGELTAAGAGLARAFMDPLIYIDPAWEYADRFELFVSPGVEQGIRETPFKPSAPSMPWLHLLLE